MNRYIALQKIVELGSFSKAAEKLGYTQSAMSQMIASLEDELSIKLLNRFRTGAKLTIEGAEIYPYMERTIYAYLAVQEKAKEIKGLETGIIRMGTLASISAHWLPALLKEFKAQYPNVEFVIHKTHIPYHLFHRDSSEALRFPQSAPACPQSLPLRKG